MEKTYGNGKTYENKKNLWKNKKPMKTMKNLWKI